MDQTEVNVSKLRAAYSLWGATHGATTQEWLDLMSEDVKMASLADGNVGMEFTQARRGKEQAATYFAGLVSAWEMVYFHADEFIAQGDRVVMVGRCAFKSRTTGKTAETPKVDIIRFKDGLIVEYSEMYDTAKAFAASQPDAG